MAMTYRALAALLRYPTLEVQNLSGAAVAVIEAEALVPPPIRRAIARLAADLGAGDLFDLQERYVWLFDRTRSLSLNLYEHVHGESRERGPAMVALLELYRELPDHLPVFLEFLSILPDAEAASLLGEASHVLAALGQRLHKRDSTYRAIFAALSALADDPADAAALAALMQEPEDDPGDLEAMDRLWAETAVTFGPADVGCPKADALVGAMGIPPTPARRGAGAGVAA